MSESNKTDWTPLAYGLGWALIILAIGGCFWLGDRDSKAPLIVIQQVKP